MTLSQVVGFTEKRTLGNGRFASSHHLYQRLSWRQHFADLYSRHAGSGKSGEQRCGIGAGNREQIYIGAAIFIYFGGQIGGQGLQQSRTGDGAMARTGWAPA